MPDIYAHQYFGDQVYAQLTPELQKRLSENIDLYNIGLQGPDPFYFYKPLKKTPVSKQADVLHEETGSEYFDRSLNTLKGLTEDQEASLAYQLGFLCHYTLDSVCHTFVNRYEKETGVTHSDMEGEFDRYLLERSGKDPLKTDTGEKFLPKKGYGKIVSLFSQGLGEKECYDAIRSYKTFRNIFHCENNFKRNLLYRIMKKAGVYNSYRGQIVNVEPYPNTEKSDQELYDLLKSAVPLCVKLIVKFVIAYDNNEPSAFLYDSNLQIPFNGIMV
ncbi:MAG: zinc dependent phospholipase C family protein [Oscillospiraceae bacterium]|nr:zinc dependent phospholipase C family protein [Oscillospiraceae bacterium]